MFGLLCIQFLIFILDIDECAVVNDCQQICENTIGSYECRCMDGFTLKDDGKNCTGIIVYYYYSFLIFLILVPIHNSVQVVIAQSYILQNEHERSGINTSVYNYRRFF